MPYRELALRELTELFGVLAHPARVRILEELRRGEKDVGSLSQLLGISHCATSQQLTVLKAHRIIVERRQGRNVFYHLRQPELANWIADGLKFIAPVDDELEQLRSAVQNARSTWLDGAARQD